MMSSIGDALDNLKKPANGAASQPVSTENGVMTPTISAQHYASQKSPVLPSKSALRSSDVSFPVEMQYQSLLFQSLSTRGSRDVTRYTRISVKSCLCVYGRADTLLVQGSPGKKTMPAVSYLPNLDETSG